MSENTTTTTPDAAETPGSTEAKPEAPAVEAHAETDWKAEARKWEQRAKDNAAKIKEAEPKLSEYDRLVEASKSELERAQATAQRATESVAGYQQRLAAAELRTALTGVVPDPAAVIEDLNIAKFIGDDGEVNSEAIAALRGKYADLAPAGRKAPAPNPAQGTSAGGPSSAAQLSKQDLERMSKAGDHEGIEKARQEGRFNSLLGINP